MVLRGRMARAAGALGERASITRCLRRWWLVVLERTGGLSLIEPVDIGFPEPGFAAVSLHIELACAIGAAIQGRKLEREVLLMRRKNLYRSSFRGIAAVAMCRNKAITSKKHSA